MSRKVLKTAGISLAIVIGAVIIAGGIYVYLVQSEINKMEPLDSRELTGGVYVVRGDGYVDFYVVKNGDSLIAFDAGADAAVVEKEMARLNFDPRKVTAVFLTHTDGDHVAGLPLFPLAKVYISADEEQMINGKTPRFLFVHNSMRAGYSLLQDNGMVKLLGLSVACVMTPGHTPGSMSYIVNGTYLFSGDTMSLKNNKAELFNAFFNMDSNGQGASMTKLSMIAGVKYIFTTHYGYSADAPTSLADWNKK